MPLLVPISIGELFDKISILELKAEMIADPEKLANVLHELAALAAVRRREVAPSPDLEPLYAELRAVNRQLWQTEDALRQYERAGRFDQRFVELARSIYRDNDRRAALKRQINELTGSEIVEEKVYR
jgi:uncharacterized membrane protein YccC